MRYTLCLILLFLFVSSPFFSQVNSLEIDPVKEKMYAPYMLWRHLGTEGLAEFKKNKPHDYLKELWYYSESFYIKRNHLAIGETLDPSIIDVSRFEYLRKQDEENIVEIPGFKDVLVLLPINKLIYKP
jgi:hypothetical protein